MTELFEAITKLKTPGETAAFLRDLCTIGELRAMSGRWQVAQLLDQGLHYLEIAKRTGASTATITRVSNWLRFGSGGYRTMLDRRQRSRAR
jgi:TrpR-related protein YerC/YecD